MSRFRGARGAALSEGFKVEGEMDSGSEKNKKHGYSFVFFTCIL